MPRIVRRVGYKSFLRISFSFLVDKRAAVCGQRGNVDRSAIEGAGAVHRLGGVGQHRLLPLGAGVSFTVLHHLKPQIEPLRRGAW